jgi:hypothetical protein
MASYILTYDVGPVVNIKQWVHPYAGLFLLRSDADVWTLAKSFQEFFTEYHSHMLLPVTPGVTQGIMPKYVWDWLNLPDQAPLGLAGFLQGLGGIAPKAE